MRAVWDSKAVLAVRLLSARHLARLAAAADPRAAPLLNQLTDTRRRRRRPDPWPLEPTDLATRQKRADDLKELTATVQRLEMDLRLSCQPRPVWRSWPRPHPHRPAGRPLLPGFSTLSSISSPAPTFLEHDPAQPGPELARRAPSVTWPLSSPATSVSSASRSSGPASSLNRQGCGAVARGHHRTGQTGPGRPAQGGPSSGLGQGPPAPAARSQDPLPVS